LSRAAAILPEFTAPSGSAVALFALFHGGGAPSRAARKTAWCCYTQAYVWKPKTAEPSPSIYDDAFTTPLPPPKRYAGY